MSTFESFESWEKHMQREAFKRKKETGMKLGHCYEQLAQQAGFKTYAAMRASYRELLGTKKEGA